MRHPIDHSCGTKHDWICCQVWSLHPSHWKYYFWYFKATRQNHVRRDEADSWSWHTHEIRSFIEILDSAKNFNLASQYTNFVIILVVEQITDMKISYQLFANKFQAFSESVFELPHVKKLSTQIKQNGNDEYFYKEKLNNFQRGKIQSKTTYLSSIILCLQEPFSVLMEDGENFKTDARVVDGDKVLHKILHNTCTTLDIIRFCLMKFQLTMNIIYKAFFLRAQLQNIEILFNCFPEVVLKANSDVSLNITKEECTSTIIYSFNKSNPLVSIPRKFWKFIYNRRITHSLNKGNKAFVLVELCWCAIYCTEHLNFSQILWWKRNDTIDMMKYI